MTREAAATRWGQRREGMKRLDARPGNDARAELEEARNRAPRGGLESTTPPLSRDLVLVSTTFALALALNRKNDPPGARCARARERSPRVSPASPRCPPGWR